MTNETGLKLANRTMGLTPPAVLILALVALAGLAVGGVQWIAQHFFRTQDLPVAIALVLFVIGLRRGLPVLARSEQLGRAIERFRGFPTWPIAAATFAVALAGTWLVFGNFPLSMDEFWARADGAIIAAGEPMARIPAEWREYAPALQPIFTRILPDGLWASGYLPVNAAILSLLGPLSGPLLAGFSVLVAADLARKLLPGHKSAPLVCAVLMASSSQLLLIAMTPYAMTAHLAANLAWLWLFVRREALAHAAAAALAVLAIGLHQVVFFPLFALPFLFEAFLERRRGAAIGQVLAIGVGFLFWSSYDKLLFWWLDVPPVATGGGPGGTALLFERFLGLVADFGPGSVGVMALNLIRWLLWQNPLAVPLTLAVALPLVRTRGVWRAMLAGIVLTAATMTVVLAFQGHGWGYRYLHGLLGNLCLLATYAWFRLQEGLEDRRPMRALFVAALALALVLVPFRAWQAERFTAPYRQADAAIARLDADVVLIDAPRHIYSVDLVRNDPFLASRPKRMTPLALTDQQLSAICRRYRVAIFTDADAARFGLPAPGGEAEAARALPAACAGD